MSARIKVMVNGQPVHVPAGTSAAAAVLRAGETVFHRSCRQGEARAPLCGMGICYECRATVDGRAQVRTCQVLCRPGMHIETGDSS